MRRRLNHWLTAVLLVSLSCDATFARVGAAASGDDLALQGAEGSKHDSRINGEGRRGGQGRATGYFLSFLQTGLAVVAGGEGESQIDDIGTTIEGFLQGLLHNKDYSNFLLEGGDTPPPGYPGSLLSEEQLSMLKGDARAEALKDEAIKAQKNRLAIRVPGRGANEQQSPRAHGIKIAGLLLLLLGSYTTIPWGRHAPKCHPLARLVKYASPMVARTKEIERNRKCRDSGNFLDDLKNLGKGGDAKATCKGCIMPQNWGYTESALRKWCRRSACLPPEPEESATSGQSKCPGCCFCTGPKSIMMMRAQRFVGFLMMLLGGFLMWCGGVALGAAIFLIFWCLGVVSNVTFAIKCRYEGC